MRARAVEWRHQSVVNWPNNLGVRTAAVPWAITPHADHIHPLSKGGRSVAGNMVWVCANCNSMKRDLTLAGFVRKFGLDRQAIENRLQQLGKEY